MMRAMMLALAMFASACSGPQVRDDVLVPAMQHTWSSVALDVEAGATLLGEAQRTDVLAEAQRIGAALDSGDRRALATLDWQRLSGVAAAGIDSRLRTGVIGPGVARSLHERLSQFSKAWASALER